MKTRSAPVDVPLEHGIVTFADISNGVEFGFVLLLFVDVASIHNNSEPLSVIQRHQDKYRTMTTPDPPDPEVPL